MNCKKPITSKTVANCRPDKLSRSQRLPRRRQRQRNNNFLRSSCCSRFAVRSVRAAHGAAATETRLILATRRFFLDRQSLLFLEGLGRNDFFPGLCLPHWRGVEQTLPAQPRIFSIQRDQFIVRAALDNAA